VKEGEGEGRVGEENVGKVEEKREGWVGEEEAVERVSGEKREEDGQG